MQLILALLLLFVCAQAHAQATVIASALTAHDGNAAETTTADVDIPGGGCAAGQVLLQFLAVDDNPVVTLDGDLTLIDSGQPSAGTSGYLARRTCDGTEGTQFNNSFGAAQAWAACVLKLNDVDTAAGSDGGFDFAGVSHGGAFDGAPNPPSLSPTGGSDDYLWLIFGEIDGDSTVTTWATNYAANGISIFSDSNTAGAQQATVICSWRTTTAATEDPGATQMSRTNEEWYAWTLAAYPAAAAAPAATRNVILLEEQMR